LVPTVLSRELLGPHSVRFAHSVNRFTEKIRIGRTVRSRFCVRGAPLRGRCCCCLGRYAEAGRGKETQVTVREGNTGFQDGIYELIPEQETWNRLLYSSFRSGIEAGKGRLCVNAASLFEKH